MKKRNPDGSTRALFATHVAGACCSVLLLFLLVDGNQYVPGPVAGVFLANNILFLMLAALLTASIQLFTGNRSALVAMICFATLVALFWAAHQLNEWSRSAGAPQPPGFTGWDWLAGDVRVIGRLLAEMLPGHFVFVGAFSRLKPGRPLWLLQQPQSEKIGGSPSS